MKTSIRQITGNWDGGYALDKHIISSTCTGNNAQGHPQFNTLRTETGEALYQLKYKNDWTQIDTLASELKVNIYPKFENIEFLIPMPASNVRARQPVTELTLALGKLVEKPVFVDLLTKKFNGKQLKDMNTKEAKIDALKDCFSVIDTIKNTGSGNALLVDDLYHTGASLEAACEILRRYKKIKKLYVATLTWKQ